MHGGNESDAFHKKSSTQAYRWDWGGGGGQAEFGRGRMAEWVRQSTIAQWPGGPCSHTLANSYVTSILTIERNSRGGFIGIGYVRLN